MDLIVDIKEIKGTCPVYKSGDTFVIKKGYVLDTTRSSPVCMHSLAPLMPYYVALSKGVSKRLGTFRHTTGFNASIHVRSPVAVR